MESASLHEHVDVSLGITLESERLLLLPLTSRDFSLFYLTLTHRYVREYLCDNRILEEAEVIAMLQRNQELHASSKTGLWKVIVKDSNEYIGFAGLWSFFEEEQPQLLYALLPRFLHRGYATEAASQLIQYSFGKLNFKYIDASFDSPNIASQRVCERVGMKFLKEEVTYGKPMKFYRKQKLNIIL
jgi:[ribosomal protein S5]-alanine N-acetyltransferase